MAFNIAFEIPWALAMGQELRNITQKQWARTYKTKVTSYGFRLDIRGLPYKFRVAPSIYKRRDCGI